MPFLISSFFQITSIIFKVSYFEIRRGNGMKKLIVLLVLLCGTGSFMQAPDAFTDFMTQAGDHEDSGNSINSQSDGGEGDKQDSQEEQILDDRGHDSQSSNSSSRTIQRTISWGDDPVEDPNTAGNRGEGATIDNNANIPSATQMATDNATSASRGLYLKDTRLESVDDENSNFFSSLSPEDQKLMRDNRDLISEHMMDKLIDKKLFGERPLREGETRESIINKYKGRKITVEAQARRAASDDTGVKKPVDRSQRSLTTEREFDPQYSPLEVSDSDNEEQFNMLNESRSQTDDSENRQLATRNTMLNNDSPDVFFRSLSEEDKGFLQGRIDDNNQTSAIRKIFEEEGLEGRSKRDVFDEYKADFASEEEPENLQHSEGLEGDIKELEAKIERGEGSYSDERYLKELKDTLKKRQESLANIMDATMESKERFSGDLNLTQRSSTELANYRSEALKDQIEKARSRLARVDRAEKEDIAKALERLGDDATDQEKDAAIEKAKEGLSADRKSLEGELNGLLAKDQTVGQYLTMSDRDRAFKFLDAVSQEVDQRETSFEQRKEGDQKDPATFFSSSRSMQDRLGKYEKLLTSKSMNELADEDPQFKDKRQALLDRVESQFDALRDRENELLPVRADKILEEINRSDEQGKRSFNIIESDLNMLEKRIEKQKEKLEEGEVSPDPGKMENLDKAQQKVQEAYDNLGKKIIETFNKQVNSLDGEVEHYLALKKGTRTQEEYNVLSSDAGKVFNELGTRIDSLAKQEKALGVKETTKRSWWFGKKRTIIDDSDVSEEDKAKVKEIQEQKEQLQALQERSREMYSRVENTDPKNARGFRSLRKRFQWGFLSSEPAPKRYSFDDLSRLGDSGRNKLSKENLEQYSNRINQTQDPQGQPKKGRSFFSKKG